MSSPRRSRHASSSRVKEHQAKQAVTPRLLSEHEKRELIMAHAAARAPQDTVQRVTLWAGIAVALVVIVGGWFLTVGWSVREAVRSTGPSQLRTMTDELRAFTDQLKAEQAMQAPELPSTTSQATAADFAELVRSHITSSTSDVSTPSSTLFDPHAPGLTLE
jgi:hypothetical protein